LLLVYMAYYDLLKKEEVYKLTNALTVLFNDITNLYENINL